MRNQKNPKQPLVSDNIAARLRRFEEERDRMVDTIRAIVQIESPSDDKFSVDRVGAIRRRTVRGTRRGCAHS
jgi:hypothetical protein